MRVGYDIDGVLCDFKSGIIRESRYYDVGSEFPNSPNEWDSYKPNGFNKLFKNCRKSASFWLSLKVLPDAWFHQPFIRKYGAVYITARPATLSPSMYDITREWLTSNNFAPLPLIVDDNKVRYTSTYALDYFIEDKFENWVLINEARLRGETNCVCLLLNTPHNETLDYNATFKHLRYNTLKEIEDVMNFWGVEQPL